MTNYKYYYFVLINYFQEMGVTHDAIGVTHCIPDIAWEHLYLEGYV